MNRFKEFYNKTSPGWKILFDSISNDDWISLSKNIDEEYINEELFKPFVACPFENVKVIIFGKEYCHYRHSPKPNFSMYGIPEFKEKYISDIYNMKGISIDKIDFERLSSEGILFINWKICPYYSEYNPWEPILNQVLQPLFKRGWIINVITSTNKDYIAFIKKIIADNNYIINLKINFDKTKKEMDYTFIGNSNLFVKLNSYLEQWCQEPINW